MKFSKAFIAAALTLSSLSASAEYDTVKMPEEVLAIRQAVGMALVDTKGFVCTDLQEKSISYDVRTVQLAITNTSTIFRNLETQPVLKFLRNDMPTNTTGHILITTDYSGKKIITVEFKTVSQEKTLKNIGTIYQPKFVPDSPKIQLHQVCKQKASNTYN